MNKEDFNNLDPKTFGNWPIPIKGLIIIVLCTATLFAGYWFDTQNQITDLAKLQEEEHKKVKEFEDKQWKAATLPKLKEQLVQIEAQLKELLGKLPNNVQVDELIRDISKTVLAHGLTQELFKPEYNNEKSEKGVYVKLPIKLKASGDYHAFGKFVSGVAALHRIVTLHDVSITQNKKNGKQPLTLEITAQIYRYLEKSEEEEKKPKKTKPPKPKKSGHGH